MSRVSPPPSSYVARRTMEANRRTDTTPERLLRSALHAQGLRYRKDRRITAAGRPVRPDLVFGPALVAVFVDGCFWHRCPIHATRPVSNAEYWQAKFDRNLERDRADNLALAEAGWTVLRVWEHEDSLEAAERIEAAVRAGRDAEAKAARAATSGKDRSRRRRDDKRSLPSTDENESDPYDEIVES